MDNEYDDFERDDDYNAWEENQVFLDNDLDEGDDIVECPECGELVTPLLVSAFTAICPECDAILD